MDEEERGQEAMREIREAMREAVEQTSGEQTPGTEISDNTGIGYEPEDVIVPPASLRPDDGAYGPPMAERGVVATDRFVDIGFEDRLRRGAAESSMREEMRRIHSPTPAAPVSFVWLRFPIQGGSAYVLFGGASSQLYTSSLNALWINNFVVNLRFYDQAENFLHELMAKIFSAYQSGNPAINVGQEHEAWRKKQPQRRREEGEE